MEEAPTALPQGEERIEPGEEFRHRAVLGVDVLVELEPCQLLQRLYETIWLGRRWK
jgi:hypothetical protein